MPTVLPVVLSLFALFLIQLLLGLRRVARNVGSVCLRELKCDVVDQTFNVTFTAISPVHFSFLAWTLFQEF